MATARREHTDVFGESTALGEDYYSRETGPDWSDVIKVSSLSMERLLYVVVGNHPRMAKLADTLRTLSQKKQRRRSMHGLERNRQRQKDNPPASVRCGLPLHGTVPISASTYVSAFWRCLPTAQPLDLCLRFHDGNAEELSAFAD